MLIFTCIRGACNRVNYYTIMTQNKICSIFPNYYTMCIMIVQTVKRQRNHQFWQKNRSINFFLGKISRQFMLFSEKFTRPPVAPNINSAAQFHLVRVEYILLQQLNLQTNQLQFKQSAGRMLNLTMISVKKNFRALSWHQAICLCTEFKVLLTPEQFLPIDTTFFANMGWEYIPFNIWTVVHQSELELSDLDQNWAKTRPLLFKTFELPNAMDTG